MRRARRLGGLAAAASAIALLAVAPGALASGSDVATCYAWQSGGHKLCMSIGPAGYFQIKAANSTPSVPYSWVATNVGNGIKTNYTWTAYMWRPSNTDILIDNRWPVYELGTYKVSYVW